MRSPFAIAAVMSIFFGLSTTVSLAQDPKTQFTIKKSPYYTIKETSRSQSKIESDVILIFEGQKIEKIGKQRCGIVFDFISQNNNLTKDQINKFTESAARKKLMKAAIGRFVEVSALNIVTLQGYKGHELIIELTKNIGNADFQGKGIMVMIETPQGRMTQTCLAPKADYKNFVDDFRAVTQNISLPE